MSSVRDEGREAKKNMKRKVTVPALCAMLLALCVSAEAQQPKKVFRIGYLSVNDAVGATESEKAIRLALRERGYIEDQNIAIEYRYSAGKPDRASELAAELVRLEVDVIVVAGGPTWDASGEERDQDDTHCYGGSRRRSGRGRSG